MHNMRRKRMPGNIMSEPGPVLKEIEKWTRRRPYPVNTALGRKDFRDYLFL